MPYPENNTGIRLLSSRSGARRAIVIGGGIAGLLASRVLADHFDEVLLLERDKYPADSQWRAGVPQGRHVHLLLLRGKQVLETLFPGLHQELTDKGAGVVKMGKELGVLTYYGWRVKHSGNLSLLTFTRPLLEWLIRQRLNRIPSIQIIDECPVSGLITEAEGRRVIGVRCRAPKDSSDERQIFGEFTVDAGGRFSRTPEWLQAIGYQSPEETIVDPFLGYASRLYETPDNFAMPQEFQKDWKALLLLGKPPDQKRGGVLLPVENNRWHVTLVGIGKDYPQAGDSAFLEFARSLRSPVLYEMIRNARPLSPVFGYRATRNRRRHYEHLSRWPEGFVVMGDALCAFNPVYAQGMSIAGMEAMILDRHLRTHLKKGQNGTGLASKFQREVAEVIETPWLMATTEDARWPATAGAPHGPTTHLIHQYLDKVIELATESPEVDHRFARVAHLLDPAYMLFHPRIALRVFSRLMLPG